MTLMFRIAVLAVIAVAGVRGAFGQNAQPRTLDERLQITLFAEHPEIVTPTGIDVDHAGRVWAIESNTHFRPDDYDRHPSDRILVMQDSDGDGRADKITVFADGFTHAMSVAVKPVWLQSEEGQGARDKGRGPEASGNEKARGPRLAGTGLNPQPATRNVFIATRRAIWLLSDTDGDLEADRRKRIVRLDTPGDYPHNGLAGFAFDAMGWMYFGFGENLGEPYKLIGSDGTTLEGGGEGGNLYRCRPDGTQLKEWATGFWNPHASCVDAFGRLFTVDNDPDSRPPCRLLHIVEGGDYGFRFRNGRKGRHPFTAWNGEIPGTLPMVSGTGEAPSGIVTYESDDLPEDYIGNLLVTSWGDHRIDRFRLKPRGASFQSLPETIIQGGEDFRPVGIAVAPDGSLYLTDWVKKDYHLHGHGRVWRVSAKEPARVGPESNEKSRVIDTTTITSERPVDTLTKLLDSPRLEVRRTAATRLRLTAEGRQALLNALSDARRVARTRTEALWSLAQVPRHVEDFDFVRRNEGPAKIAAPSGRIVPVVFGLLGTQQFPVDKKLSFVTSSDRDLLKDSRAPTVLQVFQNWIAALPHVSFSNRYAQKFLIIHAMTHSTRDPFILQAVVRCAVRSRADASELQKFARDSRSGRALAGAIAARRLYPTKRTLVRLALDHQEEKVRRLAVQWVAEENLQDLRPQVEAVLTGEPMTADLFLATLAALDILDGNDPKQFDRTPASKYVLPLLKDDTRTPAVRAQALRLVDADDPALDAGLMRNLVNSRSAVLRLEAVRTLQHAPGKQAEGLLRGVAADKDNQRDLRAEAILGLAGRNDMSDASRKLLLDLLEGDETALRVEALRSLRGRVQNDETVKAEIEKLAETPAGLRPPLAGGIAIALEARIPEGLRPRLAGDDEDRLGDGNAAAGRRVFFHPQGPGCYRCHTVNGRGGRIGPDLSRIGGALDRERLVESILEPSKEIAPRFTSWTLLMRDGKVHTGMLIGDTRDDVQRVGTSEGEVLKLKASDILRRRPQQKSIMPEKLGERMTAGELRNLLAYLQSLK